MSTLSLFVICTLCSLAFSQQGPPYTLLVQRQEESSRRSSVDLITLRCRESQSRNLELVQNVKFWFNRATPDDPDIRSEPYVLVSRENTGIVFQLPRDREGNYTCGMMVDTANVMESERVPLIALQTTFGNLLLTTVTTYFVASGGTVILHCPVQPGSLYNYYYGRWTRNGTTIVEILRPTQNGVTGEIMRAPGHQNIDLDRRTFSLMIRSANRARDASNAYQCVLSNLNPVNNNAQEFSQAAMIRISLVVNENPTVIEGPEPVIVGFQEAEANPPTFTCTIGGAPPPTSIIWTYIPNLNIGNNLQTNRAELLLSDGADYSITSNETEAANGLSLINSTLVFLSTMNTDGGIVRCKTGTDPTAEFADTLLTVLGTADDIDVIISRENDVIYELLFSVELQNPVTLNITYTNEGGESQSRIPDVGYNNTRTIAYREIVGQLPYEVYHVSIALVGVNGGQRIMGPSTIRDEIVDLRKRPDPLIIITAVLGSVLGLAMFATILVVVVLFYKYKWKSRELTNVERAIAAIKDISISDQQDDEIKKLLRTLVGTVRKAYEKIKVLSPSTAASDSDVSEDADPVDLLNQFLRDSFFQGFESQNKEEFIKTFNAIKPPDVGASNAVSVQGLQPNEIIVHRSPQEFPTGVIEMPEYDIIDDSKDTATPMKGNSNNDSKASATPVKGVTTQV